MPEEERLKRQLSWWQTGVIYQIYPRSFADASGDGTGDLRGITSKLDYLERLGVDAVWLSPFYPSPMADFGYDVSDYCDVDPLFGTLRDFAELLRGAHQRGIKVIIDFVPNHTSDEHPWFLESRSSRDNPRRDWYIWQDPAPGNPERPPSNWESIFGGGSAWGVGREDAPVLPAHLRRQAARPQLAQPRGQGGDVRRHAVLARPRRGRLQARRALLPLQGRETPG